MMTLSEYQHKEAEDQRRMEALKKTIPDLAEDKFNALPVLYTKPNDVYQAANIEEAISYMTTPEWQSIARCLRDKNTDLAGKFLEEALRRVCLEDATDEVEDQI